MLGTNAHLQHEPRPNPWLPWLYDANALAPLLDAPDLGRAYGSSKYG